jgi:small subunit ribosomal protein S20
MPSHKHRQKRLRQADKRHAANVKVKSELGTLGKNVRTAAEEGKADEAEKALRDATSALDKAAKTGRVHKKAAARRVARLAKQANKATQAGSSE